MLLTPTMNHYYSMSLTDSNVLTSKDLKIVRIDNPVTRILGVMSRL
jgi:hypothetical protein